MLNSILYKIATMQEPRSNRVFEDSKNYVIQSSDLKKESIKKWMSEAIKGSITDLPADTFAVIDISDIGIGYNTLIISINSRPILSKETTHSIMKKEIKKHGLEYHQYTEIIKRIFKTSMYRVPYVDNGKIFTPLNSPTRGYNSWSALHLLTHYTTTDTGNSLLQFSYQGTYAHIELNLTKEVIEKHIDRVAQIFQIIQKGSDTIVNHATGYLVPVRSLDFQVLYQTNLVMAHYIQNDVQYTLDSNQCRKYLHILGIAKELGKIGKLNDSTIFTLLLEELLEE